MKVEPKEGSFVRRRASKGVRKFTEEREVGGEGGGRVSGVDPKRSYGRPFPPSFSPLSLSGS